MHCHIFKAESAIVQVLEVESKSLVLALGREMMLYQLVLLPNAKVEEKIRVKLSGKWPNFHMIMAEEGILAMCSAEKDVRIWNLNTEDNGTISLRTSKGFSPGDVVVCISYSPRKGCLSGGTSDGKVATWKRRVGGDEESIEEGWKLQEAVDVGSQVTALCWAITSNALAVSTGFAVTILKEQPILSHMSSDVKTVEFESSVGEELLHLLASSSCHSRLFAKLLSILQLAAIQTGNMSFLLVRLHPTEQQELQLTLSVKGIFVGEKHIAVWDHEQIAIYEMVDSVHSPLKSQIVSCFACAVSGVAVYQQNVYCLEPEKVNVRTIQVAAHSYESFFRSGDAD
ncbi:unnamed protein product [Toxocara canis]|uniref:WD_REPEATS_REGION domain-containing protein n=1 Tax=Toxocara canis TaxID=6265 RepID=A0A183V2Y0_TOXCA|nr:unnamed protein product [Toxocara canis]